ncbi:hypothetical protein F5Y04DRAFT_278797 [Hypomontagnella monticulosa]|nr:hypothetical protein F5Y04DRAFT_278797 [Hypomontagnella monticulosa]
MESASAVLGILGVSLQTSLLIIQYTRQFKAARKDIEALAHEVETLHDDLLRARDVVHYRRDEAEEKSLAKEFQTFQELLNELSKKLEKKAKGRTSRFTWIVSKESISSGIGTARRYREVINSRILIQATSHQRRNQYHEWFSPPDASLRHNDLRDKRHENTGHWFSDTDEFKAWKVSTKDSLIWIYGIPGCGKSVLASRVIDTLDSDQNKNEVSTRIYFYFDFSDKTRQKSAGMLKSLIWQLTTKSQAAENVFTNQLYSYWTSRSQPATKALLSCLQGMLKASGPVVLVLDALDECRDQSQLLNVLTEIAGWDEKLRILVTSRREVMIEKALRTLKIEKRIVSLEGDGVDKDIRIYVRSRLQESAFERWHDNERFRAVIEESLVEKAAGMFRWVECQFFTLRDFYEQDHDGESLRRLLSSLPETLDETYERILMSIPNMNQKKTLRLLQWLSFSARPLTIREVAETMAIDVDHEDANQMRFNPSARFRMPCEILKICPGLVNTIITTGSHPRESEEITEDAEIRLAHFSVKEYLQSEGICDKLSRFSVKKKSTNRYQAHACLAYMMQLKGLTINKDILDNYPFARYSAQYWTAHVRDIQSYLQADSPLVRHVQQFLDSRDDILTWVRLFDPDSREPRHDAVMGDLLSPIYYASLCGLLHHVKYLILRGVDVDIRGGLYERPLQAACQHGYGFITRALLDAGAIVADLDGGDKAVIAAAQSGQVDVVKMLIDKEVEAIPHPEAVDAACERGRGFIEIVKLLLNRTGRRDVNAPISRSIHGTLLQRAAAAGLSSIVSLLLDMGADINAEGGWYGTALRAAALQGEELTVKILLERGADPHLYCRSPGSSLVNAIEFERASIFDLLLQCGRMNVNNNEGMYGTPLQVAACYANPYYVRKLLDRGADINAEGGLYHTALQAASFAGHLEILNLLLDNGANPNIPDEGPADVVCLTPNGGSGADIYLAPFDEAGLRPDEWHGCNFRREPHNVKNERILQILDAQPVVTIQKGMYGSALRAAVVGGHASIVRRLLDAGARVDVHGGALRSMWEIAASCGSSEIQQLLQDAGVAPDSTSHSTHGQIKVSGGKNKTSVRAEYKLALGETEGEKGDEVISTFQIVPFLRYPEPNITARLFVDSE